MSRINRRRFLKAFASAGVALGAFYVNPTEATQQQPSPNERVRVGIIGVSGQGNYNLTEVNNSGLADIVALCDVDDNRAAPIRQRFPNARYFNDYRRMLEMRELDAVVVATPDHHHAIPSVMAMRLGKHVYCEKPLAHSVHEVRTMMDTAAQMRVVTQMGTQIHAGENYRRVVELIQGDAIGTVRRVHVWCNRRPDAGFLVQQAAPVPNGLHYDLWLGPAPQRNFPAFRTGNNTSPHFHWRWWWDFGGGVLADMACHFMDLPHWALGLMQPSTISAQGRVTYQGDNAMPDVLRVDYEYPARCGRPAVQLSWYHGVSGPDLDGRITYPGFGSGVKFEGERGDLVADYSNYRLLPADRFQGFQRPDPIIPRSVGHHREWLQAIRGNGLPLCSFDYSGALSEAVLLGNVAYRAGARIQYDAREGRIIGNNKANALLRREYRRGWTL